MVKDSALEQAVAGIILAGGQARRLAGDKGLRLLGGKPLLAHAIGRAGPQVGRLALSANGAPARYGVFGLPVLADPIPGFAGPLAGILAGLIWAADEGAETLASFACDAPFFPRDLVARLAARRAESGATIACAASGGRTHPVFALWPTALREPLRRAIADGARKVDGWTAQYHVVTVTFATAPFDPFLNVNTPDDLAKAEKLLATADAVDNAGVAGVKKS